MGMADAMVIIRCEFRLASCSHSYKSSPICRMSLFANEAWPFRTSRKNILMYPRLENLQRQEKRLREILATANTVEDILKVEKELSTVRTQIESITGRLKALTGKIDLSTIQLRISEVTVMTETNFWGKLQGILRDSWVAAGDVVLYLIATVIVLSPLALLTAAIWWGWRRRQKAKQAVRSSIPPPSPPQ